MAKRFLYFAYGSNILGERILLNNPTAQFIHTARLNDYRLTFDAPCDINKTLWAGALATIRSCPGSSVWGVIWQLDMADSDNLDRQEKTYQRRTVTVTTPDGTTHTCRTYELDGEYDIAHSPSPQYKDVIVRGARQSGLPQAYISQLEAVEDNGYDGEVEVYNRLIRQLENQHQ
ncbi:gamma-glutamylcyclotransferase-like isoform X1 [Haliotis rufescens]|uniref:gamma-glutamylcyclotransferase-like isoform X1 n=1 Tax=Haliotis rufescens TaxID=6454 RepID=UPI00201F0980|nr:gamma-glutamylcyclotransferase-like isoform X1 [Haliotis rufescens]